jgi:hypothetical protein
MRQEAGGIAWRAEKAALAARREKAGWNEAIPRRGGTPWRDDPPAFYGTKLLPQRDSNE